MKGTTEAAKAVDHQTAVLALYAVFYNWTRVHKTLRVTPAMEVGLTDRLWSMQDFRRAYRSGIAEAGPADVDVVLELLAECVSQPGEAPHVHPHRKVLPLSVGRADVVPIRVPFDPFLLSANALSGAVAALGTLRRRAANLVQHW